MLMQAIARGGVGDTVRESTLKVDSGRKIPCRTGESNLRQKQHTRGFSRGRPMGVRGQIQIIMGMVN